MDDEQPHQRQTSWLGGLKRILSGRRRALSEKDLQAMIEESEEEGIINEEEGDMLASIFEFGETIVREVMVPRTDMICCPADDSMDRLLKTIISSGHSRFPIFEGTTDRIIGIVYAKDLLRFWSKPPDGLTVRQVMRPPFLFLKPKKSKNYLRILRASGFISLLRLMSLAEPPV